MLKFTVPNYEQIGQHIEDSMEMSKWAQINGGNIFRGYIINYPNSKDIKYISADKKVKSTEVKESYSIGILPALYINAISSKEEASRYQLFYPNSLVTGPLEKVLDGLFNLGDDNLFPKVGEFTVNDLKYGKNIDEFHPVVRSVYKFDNELYVRAKCDFGYDCMPLIDDKYYKNGDWVWLKVERIKWKALDDTHIVPEMIPLAGIPYRYMQEYLDKYFSKEVIQFSDMLNMANNKKAQSFIRLPDNLNLLSVSENKKPHKEFQVRLLPPKDMKILNNKTFVTSPTIGRDDELEKLMVALAQDLKLPILVGKSGVGKTAIVDELAYRIQNNDVPKFLRNQLIVELDPTQLLAGTNCRGDFEQKVKDSIDFCVENKAIMLINEIHKIYRAGTAGHDDPNDMASMLKGAIDRNNLRIIGTTTDEEYDEFFGNDSLKRRFKKIVIKEPNNEVLYQIIEQVIINYASKNNISSDELLKEYPQIVDIIIDVTAEKHREYKDQENNPSLSIGIVDTAFGYAKYYNDENLKLEHFKKAILEEDRIYLHARKEASNEIDNIIPVKKLTLIKIKKDN